MIWSRAVHSAHGDYSHITLGFGFGTITPSTLPSCEQLVERRHVLQLQHVHLSTQRTPQPLELREPLAHGLREHVVALPRCRAGIRIAR